MICEHWQVAAVPFPFVDSPQSKRRPALVISTLDFNSRNDHTPMAMVTTAKRERWPSNYSLTGYRQAGLSCPLLSSLEDLHSPQRHHRTAIDEDREALTAQAPNDHRARLASV